MWLFGKYKDLAILFCPVWAVWVVLFLLPDSILQHSISLWIWVIIIIGIDVSHVWSTIFRTYLNKEEFENHKTVLILAPIFAFILLFGIAQESTLYFWRVLAYLAVFHFMKQQYGFFALYTAKAKLKRKHRLFNDKWVIYISMIYPVIFWHLSERSFDWFVEYDFFTAPFGMTSTLRIALESVYWMVILGWFIEEIILIKKGENRISYGRILWMFTTLLNWYLGIVWFNSDLAFTLTNVVAHGIPYMALIIFYQIKKYGMNTLLPTRKIWTIATSIILLSLFLGFSEEYLWDLFIYREKGAFFASIIAYPIDLITNYQWQTFVLVLLSLPQVTHYILDGFIWKMNASNPHLKNILK